MLCRWRLVGGWDRAEPPSPAEPGAAPLRTHWLRWCTCQDGTSVSDTQSSITFRWSATANTNNYVLNVENLATLSTFSFESTSASKAVTLNKSEPYRWSVTAQGEAGSNPATSSAWRFYLAGDAQVNYAPFPPDLLLPRSGSNVFAVNNQVSLSWSASDVDNDLATYDVYLDTSDGSTLLGTYNHVAETTNLDVTVTGNTLYYWKVVATDADGNTSNSGVYTFRVQ